MSKLITLFGVELAVFGVKERKLIRREKLKKDTVKKEEKRLRQREKFRPKGNI